MPSSNPITYDDQSYDDAMTSFGKTVRGAGGALMMGIGAATASGAYASSSQEYYEHWEQHKLLPTTEATISNYDSYSHFIIASRHFDRKASNHSSWANTQYTSKLNTKILSHKLAKIVAQKSFELATQIKSYSSLHKGWDGADAEPLSEQTITEGLNFLELINADTATPHVSPAADGELMFSWKSKGKYLEAAFYGDGILYWFLSSGETDETNTIEFSGKSIPRDFMSKILSFAK